MRQLTTSERSAMAKKGQGRRSDSDRSQSAHKANRQRSPIGRSQASRSAVKRMLKQGNFPARNRNKGRGKK